MAPAATRSPSRVACRARIRSREGTRPQGPRPWVDSLGAGEDTRALGAQGLGPPSQLLHFLVQMASLEPQAGCRFCHAAARGEKRGFDLLLFEFPHRVAQARPRALLACRGWKHGVNLLGADARATAHDEQTLDDIPKLADVSRE